MRMARLNRETLQGLAIERLADAQVLFDHRRFSAAFYLAGYSIECALKSCIAIQTKEHDFPDKKLAIDSWTHKLMPLFELTGIPTTKKGQKSIPRDCDTNPDLLRNWSFIANKSEWSEEARYNAYTESEAMAIIDAISDPKDGVLQWLRRYW